MRWQQPNLTAHYARTVVYVQLNSVVVLPAKSMLWNICKFTAKKSCKSKAMFRIDLRRKIESFSFFIERNLLILLNILRIILFSIELFSAIFRKTNLKMHACLWNQFELFSGVHVESFYDFTPQAEMIHCSSEKCICWIQFGLHSNNFKLCSSGEIQLHTNWNSFTRFNSR